MDVQQGPIIFDINELCGALALLASDVAIKKLDKNIITMECCALDTLDTHVEYRSNCVGSKFFPRSIFFLASLLFSFFGSSTAGREFLICVRALSIE